MIKAEHLTRMYGDQFAVKDLSFEVKRGEVMGLLGPNGAGKSTTMKMLTCFLPPSSGDANIDGLSLAESIQVRRLVGYLPEHAPSYHDLDVEAYLQFTGKVHGIPKATLHDKIREMASACGLEQVMFRRIEELSKGYRQRVGLAASMLHDPQCLILDEPTTGLDPNQIVEIRHLIRRLGEQKTVLLSSHILPEVEAVCDRMMIIDKGELQALGTTAELSKQAQGGVLVSATIKGDADKLITRLQSTLSDVEVLHQNTLKGDSIHIEIQHSDPECQLAEALFHAAVASDVVLLEMRNERATLEDVFHQLTQGGQSS
ncbi:ATP-binding cassette domain-containing protein [Mariprofundus ferrooxydans]|nr:ATP-binding cassette domain-containing protein [Mariprofundus ferrooxydans]